MISYTVSGYVLRRGRPFYPLETFSKLIDARAHLAKLALDSCKEWDLHIDEYDSEREAKERGSYAPKLIEATRHGC